MIKLRSLFILVGLTLIAVVAVVRIYHAPPTEATVEQKLVPDLSQNLNQVSGLQITAAGNETVAELKRANQGWVVANRSNYPADMRKIRETLVALADAQLIEKKTANPEYYQRLGVRDIKDEEASGVQLNIQGLEETVSLIVGNQASGGSGTFVRRVDDNQSWLVSGNVWLAQDTVQWLDRTILDIPSEQVQAVTIRHPDGETVTAEKQGRDQVNFNLTDIPDGRELNADNAANQLSNALAALQLDDVVPVKEKDPAEVDKVIETEFRAFDGTMVIAKTFQVDDKRYVHFAVDFDETLAQRFAEQDSDEPGQEPLESASEEANTSAKSEQPEAAGDSLQTEGEGDAGVETKASEENVSEAATGGAAKTSPNETSLVERQKEARKLNDKLAPWVYEIASFQYDAMTKRMDDLLKEEESPESAQTDTEAPATPPSIESAVDTEGTSDAEPDIPEDEVEAEIESAPAEASETAIESDATSKME